MLVDANTALECHQIFIESGIARENETNNHLVEEDEEEGGAPFIDDQFTYNIVVE